MSISIACLLWLAVNTSLLPYQTSIRNDVSQSTISYVLKHPFHTVTGVSKQVKSQATIAEHNITAVQAANPTVTFRSSNITKYNNNLRVTGLLTFNGVTKEITFNATEQQTKQSLIVDGQFVISLEAYSIKRPSIFSMKVKDDLTIKFHMVYPIASN